MSEDLPGPRPRAQRERPDDGGGEPELLDGPGADGSPELLDRLQALEEENTALALANDTQRDAYERCLDEVATHVVQALLNQKDLQEECIKLKKQVCELERQNRVLSSAFCQRLQSGPGSVPGSHTE
ncbi:nck-associated protein 5-like, partial [Heterodontus francisci]|uniref:nck-associated protein 5-like n=1 Tax=Heterodontus francisci TaxID=7792 RepID=UPI00355C6D24